jgi:hypothetical protein
MKVIESKHGKRGITLRPNERLQASRLVHVLLDQGFSKEQATETIARLFDGLEEQLLDQRQVIQVA